MSYQRKTLKTMGNDIREKQFCALDSWRGIAAMIVALYHINAPSHIGKWTLIVQGGFFIFFFFVLSGFLMACKYEERISSRLDFARFMVLRFGRLFPLHLFVLAAFMAWYYFVFGTPFADHKPMDLGVSIFLMGGLGIGEGFGWNPPSWSISTEFYTYVLFGALVDRKSVV